MAEDTCIWTMARTARTDRSCSIKGIYKALIVVVTCAYTLTHGPSRSIEIGHIMRKHAQTLSYSVAVVPALRLYHLFQIVRAF